MIIERFKPERWQDVVDIVRNFHEESLKEYEQAFDINVLNATIDRLKDQAFLLIVDNKCEGLIAGQVVTPPFSTDKIYQEMIWFVNKEHRQHGVHLLNKALELLKADGFKAMVLCCMANSKTDKVTKLYERMGFMPFEQHFMRSL